MSFIINAWRAYRTEQAQQAYYTVSSRRRNTNEQVNQARERVKTAANLAFVMIKDRVTGDVRENVLNSAAKPTIDTVLSYLSKVPRAVYWLFGRKSVISTVVRVATPNKVDIKEEMAKSVTKVGEDLESLALSMHENSDAELIDVACAKVEAAVEPLLKAVITREESVSAKATRKFIGALVKDMPTILGSLTARERGHYALVLNKFLKQAAASARLLSSLNFEQLSKEQLTEEMEKIANILFPELPLATYLPDVATPEALTAWIVENLLASMDAEFSSVAHLLTDRTEDVEKLKKFMQQSLFAVGKEGFKVLADTIDAALATKIPMTSYTLEELLSNPKTPVAIRVITWLIKGAPAAKIQSWVLNEILKDRPPRTEDEVDAAVDEGTQKISDQVRKYLPGLMPNVRARVIGTVLRNRKKVKSTMREGITLAMDSLFRSSAQHKAALVSAAEKKYQNIINPNNDASLPQTPVISTASRIKGAVKGTFSFVGRVATSPFRAGVRVYKWATSPKAVTAPVVPGAHRSAALFQRPVD